MAQIPMISVPLKATNEIDWVTPLKSYIQSTYGDDPDRYAEECATLNRLRQDMRGAGKDSNAGRDLLYRYYGQLELLDLRFPVDEQHIKIPFVWFDAFTHKVTSQYSLAFEKASIIFNISAVLSCQAADQTRSEEAGLKSAYHSFQASAGMFTYINENFLHAPSVDLSRDTVKTLIAIMLAQAQEVFLEKQMADQKKPGLLAKLASQAGTLFSQAIEGVQDNVNKAIFEKVWLLVVQIKANYLNSMAQFYQAQADDDANLHGSAIARLQVAETLAKDANKMASSFPGSVPPSSNLQADCGTVLAEHTKRHLANVQEKSKELIKDNDYIYHQAVPAESTVAGVAKLPAAKPIPVSELYAGQDIQRITGPDLFAKIVPMAVTESASLYDEEKAKLIRAETERVELANGEMAASLDYLRLPGSLQVLKGGFDQQMSPDEEFRTWCDDVASQPDPRSVSEGLWTDRNTIIAALDKHSKQLDMEESVCEKMRSKYESEWTQQPSARLTTTLRGDVRNYREALAEASRSDGALATKLQHSQAEFDEMRSAAQQGAVDSLFQGALSRTKGRTSNTTSPLVAEPNLLDADFEEGGPSVSDQINQVDDILKKLNLVKRERNQVLKDLKDKVHNDDISQILILNKKSIANYEQQLFQQELEKFRPHQNRLVQANHKQASLMKELTMAFNALLQDKRVRSEQSKHENAQRQRSAVVGKYKRAYQEFLDLSAGLQSAKNWYAEMKETVESLGKNVDSFVNNRRSEGAQLLNQIEQEKAASKSAQASMEQERMRGLMERMTMDPSSTANSSQSGLQNRPSPAPLNLGNSTPRYPQTNFAGQYQIPKSPPPNQTTYGSQPASQSAYQAAYNPSVYGRTPGPTSPPATQSTFGQQAYRNGPVSPPPSQTSFNVPSTRPFSTYGNPNGQAPVQNYVPPGFVPPPPPPGPPPLGPQQTVHYSDGGPGARPGSSQHMQRPGSIQQQQQQQQQQLQFQPPQNADPWAGLGAWK